MSSLPFGTLKTIEKQQEIATELVCKLQKHFGNVSVAGGAPRDWYMGNVARDIDIYIITEPTKTLVLNSLAAAALEQPITPLGKEYDKLGSVFMCASEFTYKGESINIIFLNKNQNDVAFNHFDCDICKISWEDSGGYCLSGDFTKALATKTITFNKFSMKHLEKMIIKFCDYTFKFDLGVKTL